MIENLFLQDSEQFKLVSNSDGSVSLLSLANRKFVAAEESEKKPLIANHESNSLWEMFIMTPNPGIDLNKVQN